MGRQATAAVASKWGNQVLECYSELDLLSMSLLSLTCYMKNLACLLYQKP
jgi:hypothetical protein